MANDFVVVVVFNKKNLLSHTLLFVVVVVFNTNLLSHTILFVVVFNNLQYTIFM